MEKWVRTLFKRGTPQCGLAYGMIAFVFGLLFVTLGFWKTVLIAVLSAVGAFLGGVMNHEQALKNGLNKVIPHQQSTVQKANSIKDEADHSQGTENIDFKDGKEE